MQVGEGDFQERARLATAAGAKAFGRLLVLAEQTQGGQGRYIARFLAAVYNGNVFALDPYELRAVDVAISDDMLACLDALRWAKADLHTLVPHGERRVLAVLDLWGLKWPEER